MIITISSSRRRKRSSGNCAKDIDSNRAKPPTFDPLLNFEEAEKCDLNYYLAAVLSPDVAIEPGIDIMLIFT